MARSGERGGKERGGNKGKKGRCESPRLYEKTPPGWVVFFRTEKEGFEPSNRF